MDDDEDDDREVSSSPEEPQIPKYDPRLDELLKLRAQQRLDLLLHISTQCQRKDSIDVIFNLAENHNHILIKFCYCSVLCLYAAR
jgi:hypothetical protein